MNLKSGYYLLYENIWEIYFELIKGLNPEKSFFELNKFVHCYTVKDNTEEKKLLN